MTRCSAFILQFHLLMSYTEHYQELYDLLFIYMLRDFSFSISHNAVELKLVFEIV